MSGFARIGTTSTGLAQVVSVRSFERATVAVAGDVAVGGPCVEDRAAAARAEGAALPARAAGVDAAAACAVNASA
jgi:hypothetical protein